MKPERAVLDTTVLISGLLSTTSAPALAVEHAIASGQLIASADTLRELMSKLLSPKCDPYVTRERRVALLMPRWTRVTSTFSVSASDMNRSIFTIEAAPSRSPTPSISSWRLRRPNTNG